MSIGRFGVSVLALGLSVAGAQAGGFSRGTADTDILYEDGNFNLRTGAIIVFSSQKFTANPGGSDTGGVVGTNYMGGYVIPSAAVKFRVSDRLNCAGTYTDAFGADSEYAAPYGTSGVLEESFKVSEFGATCAAFFPAGDFSVGKGRFAVLGGLFVEEFTYDLTSAMPLNLELGSRAYGWRAGIAYEIPELAFRTELMYRSGSEHTPTGMASGAINVPAYTTGSLPQSVELKVRSGIAPGWLAFGSVKWMDWSVNETFIVEPLGVGNEYYWRDGWTVTGGIAHSFTERVSGLAMLQWDRGVSTGYDLRGDKWLLSGGLSMKDSLGGELRVGGGVAHLAAVDITKGNNTGASVDTGWAGFLSLGYSVKW